jgi:hypothetical protein
VVAVDQPVGLALQMGLAETVGLTPWYCLLPPKKLVKRDFAMCQKGTGGGLGSATVSPGGSGTAGGGGGLEAITLSPAFRPLLIR